jgi:hypothetical protein
MSDLLAALIATARPSVIVAVGEGDDTTLTEALRRMAVESPTHRPRLVTTDDEVDELDTIDLAWIGAGTLTDSARWMTRVFPRIRPGGIVAVAEPITAIPDTAGADGRPRWERTPLWEELCWRLDETYELLTFPGTADNPGVGILRRRADDEIVTRAASFEDEMLALGEAPVRIDAVGVGERRRERVAQQALVNVMSDARARAVYGCICAGISSMVDIGERLGMTSKDVAKVIARLVSGGLVDNHDGLRDDPTAWSQHALVDAGLLTRSDGLYRRTASGRSRARA